MGGHLAGDCPVKGIGVHAIQIKDPFASGGWGC